MGEGGVTRISLMDPYLDAEELAPFEMYHEESMLRAVFLSVLLLLILHLFSLFGFLCFFVRGIESVIAFTGNSRSTSHFFLWIHF